MAQNRNSDGTFAGKNAKFKNIFDEIQQVLDGVRPYPLRNRISTSIETFSYEWFLSNVKKLSRLTTKNALLKNSDLQANTIEIGGLYQYVYDPLEKSKIEMMAYDTFPLVLVFNATDTGFIGLNMHYLSPRLRFFLFAKLLAIGNTTGSDKNKKLQLTWQLLKGATKIPEFMPCVHQYRRDRLRSSIIKIPLDEWKIAAVMPNAGFKKMSEQSVWAESFRQISKHRIN